MTPRFWVTGLLLLFLFNPPISVFSDSAPPAGPGEASTPLRPAQVPEGPNPIPMLLLQQGDAYLFSVEAPEGSDAVVGSFAGLSLSFFKQRERRYGCLIGIDLQAIPVRSEIRVEFLKGTQPLEARSYPVEIKETVFGTEALTLPPKMVNPDPQTLKRIDRELELQRNILDRGVDERLWAGPFLMPVEGKIGHTFGRRRIMNGEARRPHLGEDIAVPLGTPVHATNRGIVRLVGRYYFNGNAIFIDHGMGLFTMYFHLQELRVREGETVEKGQVIGLAGATGRATGPHLHWGANLRHAWVNPLSLVRMPVDESGDRPVGTEAP